MSFLRLEGVAGAVAAFLVAMVLALSFTPLAARLADRLGMLDLPGGYKAHDRPTPLLGGVAVIAGLVLALLAVAVAGLATGLGRLAPLAAGLLIVMLGGLIDDKRILAVRHKLLWQVVAALVAALVVGAAGVRLELFLHAGAVPVVLLTVLWIVMVTNAMNFLDHVDGVCAGIGAIAGGALALYNLRTGEPAVATAAAGLSGACLGFLPFNWPRARIFLGDTGSMSIGFALATLAVMGVYTPGAQVPFLAVLAPLFVLAVPLADAVLVIGLRLRAGAPPWRGDRRHIGHRLCRRGLAPHAAAAVTWGASAACGLAALLLPAVTGVDATLLVVLVGAVLATLAMVAGWRGLGE